MARTFILVIPSIQPYFFEKWYMTRKEQSFPKIFIAYKKAVCTLTEHTASRSYRIVFNAVAQGIS